MSDRFGPEPRKSPAVALNARVTALETTAADHETRIDALEAGAAAAQQIYTCPMGATVRQLVYQSGDGAVDLADASDPLKMPAIGYIVSKPTPTTCVIQDEDELGGFVGLTPDVPYYVSPTTPGDHTPTLPDVLAGEVVQQVNTPKTAAIIRIEISTPPPVNP